MDTYIAYYDETGDDGVTTKSSHAFILTCMYMNTVVWQDNYNKLVRLREELKNKFGFHLTEELHTKHLLSDKDPYRKYGWLQRERLEIIEKVAQCICNLDVKIVNVIIDKTKIQTEDYHVLENALTYSIQRIDNDSRGNWNYIIITDEGRIVPMRRTARAIRKYNPIQSQFSCDKINHPVKNLIEDILDKNSKESYFIQICDFVSYLVHLFYSVEYKKDNLPNRVKQVIGIDDIRKIMDLMRDRGIFNIKASGKDKYGFVIYPK